MNNKTQIIKVILNYQKHPSGLKYDNWCSRVYYVLNFIQNHPLFSGEFNLNSNSPEGDIKLTYGNITNPTSPVNISIPIKNEAPSLKKSSQADVFANKYEYKDLTLYSVETKRKPQNSFFKNYSFQFDIIDTIFFHISRYEEYYCKEDKKDRRGRMKEDLQFLVEKGINHTPVLDHLVFAFSSAIGLEPKRIKTNYSLTHDIDIVQKFKNPIRAIKSLVRSILEGHQWLKMFYEIPFVWLGVKKDPYDSFDYLLIPKVASKQLTEKIIFLMAGGTSKYDNHYSIEEKNVKTIIKKAKFHGYEIGLHSSFNTDKSLCLFKAEKEKLEEISKKIILHSRQHLLHYNFKVTSYILDKNKVQTDSSLGYHSIIGFRCGTGFPFHLYNFEEKRPFQFIEKPMIVMDVGLLRSCNFDIKKVEKELDEFLKKNEYLTHIQFNFHNSTFDYTKKWGEELKSLYLRLFSR